MKKGFALMMVLLLLFTGTAALAEAAASSTVAGMPPDMPSGQAPGGGAAPGGMGGGQSSQPDSYIAVTEITADTALAGDTIESTGTDENAINVSAGTLTLSDATIIRTSSDSTGGDNSSFYGVGAAVLVTGGMASISDSTITTDASGGAGVFAYGEGIAYVSDTTITTAQGTSGGIHVAGGGTLYARNLTVETNGGSAAAIRSDRGSGTMVIDGGTYTSNGTGSPAIYCTADITVNDATLVATGSEALCLEGLNTVRLFDSDLSGNMPDSEQNDNTWTVILYQSMSGDAETGEGLFTMVGGTLTSSNGGLFYTTNTQSEFVLSGVTIKPSADGGYFLRCTGNVNQRGWGTAGANGADCTFTAIAQQMDGNIVWDSISQLDLYALNGSELSGAVTDDESCAGNGGNGYASLYIDATSSWVVTGDSTLTNLYSEGAIIDANGNTVSIVGTDGTVYVPGTSQYTVTVSQYAAACDASGAGGVPSWSDYAVSFE
ncbi:MAG: hypothetical protein LLF96_02775 [Eubacteriales bacterium]|nr:hypothetical protein [Eubacteriales bacterium]